MAALLRSGVSTGHDEARTRVPRAPPRGCEMLDAPGRTPFHDARPRTELRLGPVHSEIITPSDRDPLPTTRRKLRNKTGRERLAGHGIQSARIWIRRFERTSRSGNLYRSRMLRRAAIDANTGRHESWSHKLKCWVVAASIVRQDTAQVRGCLQVRARPRRLQQWPARPLHPPITPHTAIVTSSHGHTCAHGPARGDRARNPHISLQLFARLTVFPSS